MRAVAAGRCISGRIPNARAVMRSVVLIVFIDVFWEFRSSTIH
jgi:hypothetical protein